MAYMLVDVCAYAGKSMAYMLVDVCAYVGKVLYRVYGLHVGRCLCLCR